MSSKASQLCWKMKDISEESYPFYFSSERSGREFEKKYMNPRMGDIPMSGR